MFETLYRRSFTAQLQKSAAFAESRTNYLDHMNKQGLPRATIRGFARDIHCVAERLEMPTAQRINIAGMKSLMIGWRRKCALRNTRGPASSLPRDHWLRFSGLFEEKAHSNRSAENLEQFTRYMRDDRGLAPATISSRLNTIEGFLS
jgi:integrase/recombinase XerD